MKELILLSLLVTSILNFQISEKAKTKKIKIKNN